MVIDDGSYDCIGGGDTRTPERREIERLREANAWLRWGLEEIGRCTEPKAGSGEKLYYNISNEALTGAGIPMGSAGIQKPTLKN